MYVAKVYLLLASVLVPALCFNHWVVTEDGKIEYQAASPFNLRQPFDLMAFMKQEERVSILKELKDELIEYKNEFELLKEFDSFDESFFASEPKCREVKFITSQDLSISTVLPLEHKGIRIEDHLDTSSSSIPGEPFCSLSPLPFSMYALEHLEGVQNRRSLVAPPERSVLASVGMRMEVFGSLVHHALSKNSTSWVLLDLATLYWRARGHLHHAVDCIRRALHYSPTHSMDIALLNLANILHRSQHSTDALVPLLVATSIAPQVNVLHYSLGNVYASLGQLNESLSAFQRCIDLDPSDERSLSMYLGSLCELQREQASVERSRKLDSTQKKLDQFYENMEMLQRLQQPGSQSSVNPTSKRRGRVDQGGSELPAMDAVPASLPINVTRGDTQRSQNSSNANTSGEKIRSKSLKIVLIPNEEATFERATAKNKTFEAPKVPSVSVCLQRFYSTVLKEWCSVSFASRNSSEVCWVHGFPETRRTEKKRPSIRLKMKPLHEEEEEQEQKETLMVEQVDNKLAPDEPSPPKKTDDYPRAYHSLEFFPYNPLPEQLEKVIFPHRSKPLADYDDPYWPTKTVCLQLVQEVRQNPQLANFPGTFLPPAARGADIKRMYSMVPEQLPSTMKQLPYCTDILELPYSMSSLDHLSTIADRRKLNESKQETALKRVLIDAVTGDREKRFSFEESAFRTYAAMLQVGPNWALFNIASLYWRVVGDATNAIECLRRALYYAPNPARDVGLIGMANVLHGLGALEEAVIAARAALDIKTESPVGHYTLASVYSTQADYVAASLHLRAALHISVFEEAIMSLKLIRCSLKFKEEQLYLRKKMREKERQALKGEQDKLIKEMSDAVLHGKPLATRRNEPPLILEDIEPPEIPEMRVQELKPAEFTGKNAIRYLTSLSLMRKARLKKLSEKDRLALEEQMKQPQEVIKVGDEYSDSATKVSIPIRKIPVQKPVAESTPPNKETKQEPPANTQSTKQNTPASKEEDTKTPPKINLNTAEANTTNQTAPEKPSAKPDTKKPEVAKQTDKAAEAAKRKEQATQTSSPPPKRKGKTHEEIREEEIKKRFPGTRPWPTVEECLDQPPPRKLVFTSTWLSVTAKGAKIKEYIDFKPPLEHYPLLPYCHNNFEQSRKTLSHLTGMSAHPLVQYKPEKGLQEVLCNMDGNRRSLEEMATRIKTSLAKFPDSWVVSNLAALYWRIVGQGQLAIKCLKHALYFSDDNARDVALVSLSNVLYRSGFDMDALAVIHMSLEASPTLVVTHFTMANILAAQGFYVDASGFYESTLHYQPQFQPAAERLRSGRCLILLSRKRIEDNKRKELESAENT